VFDHHDDVHVTYNFTSWYFVL